MQASSQGVREGLAQPVTAVVAAVWVGHGEARTQQLGGTTPPSRSRTCMVQVVVLCLPRLAAGDVL
jgi:hypothetical protein